MRCSSQTYYSHLMLDNDFWQWNTMRWGFPQCISCTSFHYKLLAQTYTGLLWGTIYVSSHTHMWSTLLSLFYQYKRKIGNSGIRFPFSISLSWNMLPTINRHIFGSLFSSCCSMKGSFLFSGTSYPSTTNKVWKDRKRMLYKIYPRIKLFFSNWVFP